MLIQKIWHKWVQISIVKQILIGLAIGILLALTVPQLTAISLFGELFVGALKAVAPILVLFLVMSAVSRQVTGQKTNMKSIMILYVAGTFFASFVAVMASYFFPVTLHLGIGGTEEITPPDTITGVLKNLLLKMVTNPVTALTEANYIGILTWALLLGFALKFATKNTKTVISDVSNAVSQLVRWVIRFAPLGVMGLIFQAIAAGGIKALLTYGQLLLVLIGVMLFVALVTNPLIAFLMMRENPYPLVFRCLKDSGITAFFTRSSAANIPVNLKLCEKLGLEKETYAIAIPLGATINMSGAAVTIAILTLAAAHTLDISVSFLSAITLCLLATVSACGASGVAGGSLLLVPLACSLFSIPNDLAMEVVAVGFIVGVVQDSCETALNSSTDVLFTAIAEAGKKRKEKMA